MRNKDAKNMFYKLSQSVSVLFTILVFSSLAQAETIYKLKLKNGKTIKTPAYKYAGNMIQYEMYGAFISIKKASVVSIEKDSGSATSKKNTVPTISNGPLQIPVYYQVKGTPSRNSFNGIYEKNSDEDDEGLPFYKNISGNPYNGIFYHCSEKQKKERCAWVLGHHSKCRIYYVNDRASKEPEPVFYNLWKSRSRDKSYPDISVQRISPPATVYLARVNYSSIDFPNVDCNGTFSPVSIKNGYVKYKMASSDTELEYSGVSKGWQIRFRGSIAYKAKVFPPDALPEAVQFWEDINRRPVHGKIELLKYQ